MPRPSQVDMIQLFSYIENNYGTEIGTAAIKAGADHMGYCYATICNRMEPYKTGRGKWNLTIDEARDQLEEIVEQDKNLVPAKDKTFVPFGNFVDLKKIISSRMFYPIFITGMSGNGKTLSVEQACAALNRELIRVNITIETDEDDLIGGFRLVNGETVWHNGPVIEALERGAVLLLDEVDLASNKILCLQSVLEGKGLFLKKIGKYVNPKAGFNIISTANTKGKGSDDGRFIGTNVLNEAFLERFALTFEQEYPTPKVETKILERLCESAGVTDEEFCAKLADWADVIRKTFADDGVDEVISTRRLSHIIRAYSIWNDRMKAIKVCVNRFDEETKTLFLDLYTKLDENVEMEENHE
jgi:hypothetical protein